MQWVAKVFATVGGAGYVPVMPGTAGSAVGWLLGWFLIPRLPWGQGWLLGLWVVALGVCFALGVGAAGEIERVLGVHDPRIVVIDECWAMWAVLMVVPQATRDLWLGVVAFVVFRVLDIVKPPPLAWLSRRPGGWGIMLDDVGAALYTCVVLGIISGIGVFTVR